jgi:hypothetical protein
VACPAEFLCGGLEVRGERRLVGDWRERFGYPLLLVESFFDPTALSGHDLPRRQLALCGRHPGLSAHP